MPNVRVNKADKTHAIHAMVLAKFQPRYKQLVKRAQALTLDVYDQTVGKVGNELQDEVAARGADPWEWLASRATLSICSVSSPYLTVKTGKGKRVWDYKDLFSGSYNRNLDQEFEVQLPRSVVWPDRCFKCSVDPEQATKATQKKVATLSRHIDQFNEEVREFLQQAESIVDNLRTSKQIDDRFPELWKYLPDGVREQIKQAMVSMDQSVIDEFRKQLP